MGLNLDAGRVSAALGGAVLMALGSWLALRRPRRLETRAAGAYFGLFGLSWILVFGPSILFPWTGPLPARLAWTLAGLYLAAMFGSSMAIVTLAASYARPIARRHLWTILLPALLGIALTLNLWAGGLTLPNRPTAPWAVQAPWAFHLMNFGGYGPFAGASWFALLVAAFQVQRHDRTLQYAGPPWIALSASVSIYLLQRVGGWAMEIAREGWSALWLPHLGFTSSGVEMIAYFLLAFVLWARFILKASRPASPNASFRPAAWALLLLWLSMVLVGAITFSRLGALYLESPYTLVAGVSTIISALVLMYAILRHQMFGLAIRVRWTVSKTTLAAIFVATFFIASEAAQQFFGDQLGGPYVGIVAAGALVFAFAPLARFADRLAAKAIPPAILGAGDISTREDAYRSTVRLALRGGLTRAEEVELARIAEANGIPAARAMELRHRAEEENVAGPEGRRRPGRTRPSFGK